MYELSTYAPKYESFAAFSRRDGILTVRLHTNGGPFVLNRKAHTDLGTLWTDIATDAENRVMILTGTGSEFCTQLDGQSLLPLDTPEGWDKTYFNGKRLLHNFLDIEIPIIAAINGPATNMSELPLLSDIVLAADTVLFQDNIHFNRGVAPIDGMHVIWLELLGAIRGKYFLLMEEKLDAAKALNLGIVSEVLPPDRLMERANQIAERMTRLPTLTLRYTRVALNLSLKRRLDEGLGYGLALEGMNAIHQFSQKK